MDQKAGGHRLAARQGEIDAGALSSSAAEEVWRWIAAERVPRRVTAEELDDRWPDRPEVLSGGFVAVAMELRDEPLGVIAMALKSTGEEFFDEDLEFLAGVVGIGAMALANAESLATQRELMRDVERQATEAQRVAAERERALAELDAKLEIIERQQSAIQELSTPVLQLWDNVLALPIIGVVDTNRSISIMERLLEEVTDKQAQFVILDITGVEVVDTNTADHFIKVVRAAELLGARCVLTGVRPAVAQTLVEIGVDLAQIATLRNLKAGLQECLRQMQMSGGREQHAAATH